MSRERRSGAEPEDASGGDGPWLEPEEARPGLLLFADAVDAEVEGVLASGAVAALVVDAAALAAWRPVARRHAVALLVRDEVIGDVDGVHLASPAEVAAARTRLGPDRIVGAACGLSRHAAMVAGEAGADYVMFGDLDRPFDATDELLELVAWWNELFVLPCAAAAGTLDEGASRTLVAAGADLLAVREPTAGLVETLRQAAPRPLP